MARRQKRHGGPDSDGSSAGPVHGQAPAKDAGNAGTGNVPAGEMVLLCRVTGAQGLKGEVRITTFTETPENIAAYGPLTAPDGRVFQIEELRPVKDTVAAARLAGVTDRTAAERLRGVELYVPRACLPAPDEDEWYYGDLIGLKAVSPEGEEIGEVIAVQNYGAGDLLEIRQPDARQSLLVAFTEAAVPVVDIAAGRVTVRLPEDIEE